MQNTQLQEVLRKLSKPALKKFSEYLASPYFNKKKTLTDFWGTIKNYAPDFNIDEVEKQKIFSLVFAKKFNDAYYRNICSDMLSALLHFLTILSFEENEYLISETKVEKLIDYGLYELTEKQLKLVQKNLEKTTGRYFDKLKHRIWYRDKEATLKIRRSRNKHEEVAKFMFENNNHKAIMDHTLVKCFLIFLNQHRAAMASGNVFDFAEAKKYLTIYENGLHTNDLFVRCYYLLAKLTFLQDDHFYPELKKLILQKKTGYNNKDMENIIIGLLSYINEKSENGETYWYNELHEIYDFRLKNQLWNLNGNLGYTSLHNIVFIALQLDKIKYAEDIIKKYAQYVDISIRKHVTDLCLAWVEFYKGNAETAHEYLLSIETENMMIKYELRTLQSMIYFEKEEYLALLSYLDSFKHFIAYNSDSLEGSISSTRAKFCNYLSQLTKLKMDPDKKHVVKLKSEIEADSFLLKGWFLKHV
ncbi:MAG: hypothetical protein H7Y00_15610 [Fimbriimonadaceae bacterium]|nr:hypothetical protein [Chitinophagales bacterium]